MSIRKRTNPFRSQNRANFPPLDEFFDDQQSSGLDAVNISAISLDHSFQSRAGPCKELNFSVDMSIGGKAEMAQHRYQVHKYGIEGSSQSELQDDDRLLSPRKGPRLNSSTGDDWDRLMDDNFSNVSFTSTAIVSAKSKCKAVTMGCHTPSPDQSSDDDSGSSFFNKSAVNSLITPTKIMYKRGDENEVEWGVTLSRGIQGLDESSVSTNGSSPGRDFDKMFDAALRFHEEFNEQSFAYFEQESADDQSTGKDDGKAKRSFVSFAADTSFATSNSRHPSSSSVNQQDESSETKSVNEISVGLDFLQASRIRKRNIDVSSGDKLIRGSGLPPTPTTLKQTIDTNFGVSLIFRGDRSTPDFSIHADKSEVSSLASSACPTPQTSPFVNETTSLPSVGCQAKTVSGLFGLSPISSLAAQKVLKVSKSLPSGKTLVTTMVPFDESDDSVPGCDDGGGVGDESLQHSVPFDENPPRDLGDAESLSYFTTGHSTKRILFGEEYDKVSPLGIDSVHDSNFGLVQKKSLDLCCTPTTVKSEESYVENSLSTSMSAGGCLFPSFRTFGSNAAFRMNSYVAADDKPARCQTNCAISADPENHSLAHKMVGGTCSVAGIPPDGYFEPVTTTMEIQDTTGYTMPQEMQSLACLGFNANVVMQSLCHTVAFPQPVDVVARSSVCHNNVEFHTAGRQRGVRLSRLSKLKELGLEHKLKRSTSEEYECGDCSF